MSKFEFLNHEELSSRPTPRALVAGLLSTQAVAVLHGDSLDALDLAAHVAGGERWRGREVMKGNVLYVALNGRAGFADALRAHQAAHPGSEASRGLKFIVDPLDLNDDGEALEFLVHLQRKKETFPFTLLVLDMPQGAVSASRAQWLSRTLKATVVVRDGTPYHEGESVQVLDAAKAKNAS